MNNNVASGLASLLCAMLLTWVTTPDITDHTIPVDLTALVMRFGLTFVLTFMAMSMLARLQKRRSGEEEPRLD